MKSSQPATNSSMMDQLRQVIKRRHYLNPTGFGGG